RLAAVEQNAHGNMLFGLINLQEELAQSKVSAPIDGTWIIAKTVMTVVGELEARTVHTRTVLGAYRARQIGAAEQGHLFERFKKFPIQQQRRSHILRAPKIR